MTNPKIIIVGSGVIGAAVSYYLASQLKNCSITIVEQHDMGSGASGANLGQISILDRAQDWHMPLALESLQIYEHLQSEIDLEYEQTGGGVALQYDYQVKQAPGLIQKLENLGVKAELLLGDRIKEREPNICTDHLKGYLYCPIEGKLNPLKVTMAYLDKARDLGVEILTHTRVTGFEKQDYAIKSVLTTRGELKADFVINAAGGWAGFVAEMAGSSLPIKYHRGTAVVTQAIPDLVRGPLVGGGHLFPKSSSEETPFHIGLGLIQTKDGTVILSQATELTEVDNRDVSLEGISQLTENVLKYFPCLKDLEAVRCWSCITPYSDDGKPCYELADNVSNLFNIAGFKGAFSTAPAVAKMAARDILSYLT